jgi:Family of unknown function (DUF5715)
MHHLQSAAVLALALGLALPAVATVAPSHAGKAHSAKLKAQRAVHPGHSHKTSSAPARVAVHRAPVSLSPVSLSGQRHASSARRHHHVTVATESVTVQETIPAVPLKKVRMDLLPLVGTHESLVRQNQRTEADGLDRVENDAQLNALRSEKALLPLPASAALHVNEGLPVNRRYCRPWTAKFLADLSRAHYARFHRYLQVNSAVRTVEYQRHLIEINGNAAPADGDIASPHLTGAAIDIAKKGLSMSEVAWMRGYLLPLQIEGKLDVEEEFYQSCFHIAVYKSYAPPAKPRVPVRHSSETLLAERVR